MQPDTCRFDFLLFMLLHLNYSVNRGSYLSAPVLLNLLSELVKRDKMCGLSSKLSPFHNTFNKLNHILARILDSIHHMAVKLL